MDSENRFPWKADADSVVVQSMPFRYPWKKASDVVCTLSNLFSGGVRETCW